MARTAVIQLRNRLKKDIQILDMLSVLKQIAISEFHFLDKQRREFSKYLSALEAFFGFYKKWAFNESIFVKSPCQTPCVLAVTSDEGLLGALNSDIIEKTLAFYREHPNAHVVVMGRRGAKKLRDHGVEPREFGGVPFPLEYKAILPVKAYLLDQYLKGNIGELRVIYARCHSFARQSVETFELLPFNILRLETQAAGIARASENSGHVLVEPNARSIIDYTIALWFGRRLYELFWQSKLSELASRTIELSERHEGLSRTSQKTRVRYFRACHEVIDAGIREVYASLSFANELKGEAELSREVSHDR